MQPLESCTIANNPGGAVAVRYAETSHSFALKNCLVAGNGDTFVVPTSGAGVQSVVVSDTLCDVEVPASGTIHGTNVFSGRPKFGNPSAGDYSLKPRSAARERADRRLSQPDLKNQWTLDFLQRGRGEERRGVVDL